MVFAALIPGFPPIQPGITISFSLELGLRSEGLAVSKQHQQERQQRKRQRQQQRQQLGPGEAQPIRLPPPNPKSLVK